MRILSYKEIVHFCFGKTFNPNEKYVITLHGCSTSGKTTFAHAFEKMLLENPGSLCKPIMLCQDNFYKHEPEGLENFEEQLGYDMDNPNSIDWDAFQKCIKLLLNNEKMIPQHSYNYANCKRTTTYIKNPGYNVIIIEGLFVNNLFNEKIFNVKEFDCFDVKKVSRNEYMTNNFGFNEYSFKLIKIFFGIDKKTMLGRRIKIDFLRSGRPENETISNFEKYVYPSTIKWVNPSGLQSSNIKLLTGTTSVFQSNGTFDALASFFVKKIDNFYFEAVLKKITEAKPKSL